MLRVCLATTALLALPQSGALLHLEIRVFDGARDVTAETRVTVHRAGDRDTPVARMEGSAAGVTIRVDPGIYDARAVRQRNGRVLAIRWAERLVVMPYRDEGGHHLQVINFATGYGALQIRPATPLTTGDRFLLIGSPQPGTHTPAPASSHGYVLFVVPAGQYNLQVTRGDRQTWHRDIEVPLDRTRFIVVP
jgi:hypothetical protein